MRIVHLHANELTRRLNSDGGEKTGSAQCHATHVVKPLGSWTRSRGGRRLVGRTGAHASDSLPLMQLAACCCRCCCYSPRRARNCSRVFARASSRTTDGRASTDEVHSAAGIDKATSAAQVCRKAVE